MSYSNLLSQIYFRYRLVLLASLSTAVAFQVSLLNLLIDVSSVQGSHQMWLDISHPTTLQVIDETDTALTSPVPNIFLLELTIVTMWLRGI